jgi:predicted HicB family RNase H-like nuclease
MSAETIVLKPELREFLEQSAQQEERSVNDLVNEALEYYFHTRQVEKINQEIDA